METQQQKQLIFQPAVTDDHFAQILELQRRNLYTAISTEQQSQDGFVFAEHNMELLKKMAAHLPQIIALHGEEVIGYSLAMDVTMQDELPSLAPMFMEFGKCMYAQQPLTSFPFIVGGQVCVAKAFRGRGLIGELYRATKNSVGNDFRLCVTEIAVRNEKSLKAHQKIGFEVLGTYHDGTELWNIVVWDFNK